MQIFERSTMIVELLMTVLVTVVTLCVSHCHQLNTSFSHNLSYFSFLPYRLQSELWISLSIFKMRWLLYFFADLNHKIIFPFQKYQFHFIQIQLQMILWTVRLLKGCSGFVFLHSARRTIDQRNLHRWRERIPTTGNREEFSRIYSILTVKYTVFSYFLFSYSHTGITFTNPATNSSW